MPIAAFVFGGRLSHDLPLVFQTFDWAHGVYAAATMGSEATAAAESTLPQIRRDPMAMLPFCGYHMADYFAHWLELGRKLASAPPIFRVNWFRRDEGGRWLWPGFGENARVLAWIVERARGRAAAHESVCGFMPRREDLPLSGLELSEQDFASAMSVDPQRLLEEAKTHDQLLSPLLERLPPELIRQRDQLRSRLAQAAEAPPRAKISVFPRPIGPTAA